MLILLLNFINITLNSLSHLLSLLYSILGTPDEDSWPGCTSLPDWNTSFPQWPALSLHKLISNASEEAADLLEQLLVLDPRRRPSARDAMAHAYFSDLTPSGDM